jgi:glucan endo-1,3-alpha-glucosidase
VANLTNAFKDSPSQFKVDGKPFVSTFEGGSFEDGWTQVRPKVPGGIYLVPDWSSLGPAGIAKAGDKVDGACKLCETTLLRSSSSCKVR